MFLSEPDLLPNPRNPGDTESGSGSLPFAFVFSQGRGLQRIEGPGRTVDARLLPFFSQDKDKSFHLAISSPGVMLFSITHFGSFPLGSSS